MCKRKRSRPPDGGAATYDDGKPPLELLPPDVLLEIAKVHAHGKHKYGHEKGGSRNWERGMSWTRQIGCAKRHIEYWLLGQDHDPESRILHLAHAAWRIHAALAYELRGIGEDDRHKLPEWMDKHDREIV